MQSGRFFFSILVCFTFLSFPLYAQSERSLARSFRAFYLGMDLEELKEALQADELFHYRGERDISLLPSSAQTIIDTIGLSFIRRAFFQLQDGKLYIIALNLDQDRVDHYSIFTQLVSKYGDPDQLDPKTAVWISEDTRISLERPLTVKYMDMGIFDELSKESDIVDSQDLVLRRAFINEF